MLSSHKRIIISSIKNIFQPNIRLLSEVNIIDALFNKQKASESSSSPSSSATILNDLIQNSLSRKCKLEVNHLQKLFDKFDKGICSPDQEKELNNLLLSLPNWTSQNTPIGEEKNAKLLYKYEHPSLNDLPSSIKSAADLLGPNGLNQLRLHDVTFGAPFRTYYCIGDLALLESALVQYTLDQLKHIHPKSFQFISVPDILPSELIEACGFPVRRERSQVYHIHNNNSTGTSTHCLAGTGEMGLAAYVHSLFSTHNGFSQQQMTLPLRLCTVSRCYRREVPSQEPPLYRVHQFTKVEMFALTQANESEEMFEEIMNIQQTLFRNLELSFRVLEMPSEELGLPAFRKVDIEAWMPGENKYGEISSASNCTDYQALRLGLAFPHHHGYKYLHTLNGTACAVTRTMKALVETHQKSNGCIELPRVLWPYMNGKSELRRQHPAVSLSRIRALK